MAPVAAQVDPLRHRAGLFDQGGWMFYRNVNDLQAWLRKDFCRYDGQSDGTGPLILQKFSASFSCVLATLRALLHSDRAVV